MLRLVCLLRMLMTSFLEPRISLSDCARSSCNALLPRMTILKNPKSGLEHFLRNFPRWIACRGSPRQRLRNCRIKTWGYYFHAGRGRAKTRKEHRASSFQKIMTSLTEQKNLTFCRNSVIYRKSVIFICEAQTHERKKSLNC